MCGGESEGEGCVGEGVRVRDVWGRERWYMYVRISMCIVVCVCECVCTCVCKFVSVHDGIDNCVHLLCRSPKGHIIFLWSGRRGQGEEGGGRVDGESQEGRKRRGQERREEGG